MKHSNAGDRLPGLVEVPVFGSSQNHALLQLADIVASALSLPIAARVYCAHQWPGVHTDPRFDALRHRYAARLSDLQYGYQDTTGDWREGIVVSDPLGHLPSSRLFQAPYRVYGRLAQGPPPAQAPPRHLVGLARLRESRHQRVGFG